MATIVIDAGHGGFDNGAMYNGRKEKDDNLRLALAVGKLLEQKGYDVIYTRTTDVYQSPYEKAQIANDAGADYFVSFHRNSGEVDNTYNGVQTLVYGGDERAEQIADSINRELEKTGFVNLGIEERPVLVVLRRTEMPAVLIEAGFINSDKDNLIFDENFEGVAKAIATGIENEVPLQGTTRPMPVDMRTQDENDRDDEDDREDEDDFDDDHDIMVYGVEVGRFGHENTANFLAEQLQDQGFMSFVFRDEGILHVVVGKENSLEDALKLQEKLRKLGYRTMIVSSELED